MLWRYVCFCILLMFITAAVSVVMTAGLVSLAWRKAMLAEDLICFTESGELQVHHDITRFRELQKTDEYKKFYNDYEVKMWQEKANNADKKPTTAEKPENKASAQ